jgi:hypothetical protein
VSISCSAAAHASVPLLTDLHSLTQEHDRCDELDGGVDEIEPGEWRIWFTCTCGAVIARSADEE